jgi:hypothetical protein
MAANGVSPAAMQNFTLTVDASPSIESGASVAIPSGQAVSFILAAAGTPTPALSESGTLPSGVTFIDNGDATATLAGTPAAGTGGSYPLTITAANSVSPAATQSFTLTIQDPPSALVSSPASGQTYLQGQSVPTVFACQEGAGGPGMSSCVDSNGATGASGQLDTSQLGSNSYTVTATSSDGLSNRVSISYTVEATLPTRTTTTMTTLTPSVNPATTGAGIALTASVTPTPGGGTVTVTDSGVPISGCTTVAVDASGSVTCHTTYTQDATHVIAALYSGDATSAPSNSATLTELVTDAPKSTGAAFSVGQSATNGHGGFDAQIPLPGPGTVTARAPDAQAEKLLRSVTIQATSQGIAVLQITPSRPAMLLLRHGQTVNVHVRMTYTPPGGAAVARIVTVTLRNPFVVRHIHVERDGDVRFDVTVPGPGQINVMESAWKANELLEHAVLLGPAPGRFIFTRKYLVAERKGIIHVTLRPNTSGLRLVARHRGGTLRIRLWVTYQGDGGTPHTVGYYGLVVVP